MNIFSKKINAGDNVRDVISTDECTVMQLENESGEGTMTAYQVLPGVCIMYNDFHMASCVSEFHLVHGASMLAIDHCREGRIEAEIRPEIFTFLQENELRIDNRSNHSGMVIFPLEHYHGITIGFDLPAAQEAIGEAFPGFSVGLSQIREKYVRDEKPYILKKDPGTEHIFSELYHVPAKMKREYYVLKILELLLYLDALTLSDVIEERPYFYRGMVEKIKGVHDLITQDLKRHYTIEELAVWAGISATALKGGFKELYGDSIYSYQRRYRLNTAAKILRLKPESSVGEIAAEVGYENQGKFSAAFKRMTGVTPLEYRVGGGQN